MVTEWSIVEVVDWINNNFGIIGAEKVYAYGTHSTTGGSCSVKESSCLDSFRRQRSCKDLHEDEAVILNSELTTHSLVSEMENCLCICTFSLFHRHS